MSNKPNIDSKNGVGNNLRAKIVELTSAMLDNPDSNEIYPTTKFYNQLEKYILQREERIKIASYAEGMKAKFEEVSHDK